MVLTADLSLAPYSKVVVKNKNVRKLILQLIFKLLWVDAVFETKSDFVNESEFQIKIYL